MRALMTLHICFSFTVFLNDCQYLVHYQILCKEIFVLQYQIIQFSRSSVAQQTTHKKVPIFKQKCVCTYYLRAQLRCLSSRMFTGRIIKKPSHLGLYFRNVLSCLTIYLDRLLSKIAIVGTMTSLNYRLSNLHQQKSH